MKFSANLGFLWKDRPLPAAIRAAKVAGFDAVECHWPYDNPSADVREALTETGLPLLGLNTSRGDTRRSENGLSALPGREGDAHAAIEQAVDFAGAVGAKAIHVMAGNSSGPLARAAFVANLRHACSIAGDLTILIEPLNPYDAPGYFLNSTTQAADIIREVAVPNLRLMFDFYHVQILEGDVTRRFRHLLPIIGHVQIASVPDRAAPDHGELDYSYVFRVLEDAGWSQPVGAEYLPGGDTDATLGWMNKYREVPAGQRRIL